MYLRTIVFRSRLAVGEGGDSARAAAWRRRIRSHPGRMAVPAGDAGRAGAPACRRHSAHRHASRHGRARGVPSRAWARARASTATSSSCPRVSGEAVSDAERSREDIGKEIVEPFDVLWHGIRRTVGSALRVS